MIRYPYEVDGRLDCYEKPLQIQRPSPLVVRLQECLGAESTVADIGSFSGDNGLFLTQQGHRVASVDLHHEALQDGINKSLALGRLATRNHFIEGDGCHLMFRDEQFDAVISSITLQHIPRLSLPQALNEIRRITKPGGLNALRVYSGTTEEISMKPGYSMFKFGELKGAYEALGWKPVYHDEKHSTPNKDSAGKIWITSFSDLIARKPNYNEQLNSLLIAKAEYYRRTDPEYYDYLMQQVFS